MTAEKEKTRVHGPRNAAHILREISVLVEQHGIDFPRIEFGGYNSDHVVFHLSAYHITYDYSTPASERKRAAALAIENEIVKLTEFWDALDGPLDWVANDPSESDHDRTYFRLTAIYRGVELQMFCQRDHIGEFVEQIESGPQHTEYADGAVQLVRQQVTVWKPNITIGRRATHQAYELESKPLVLALTEADPF